MSRGPRGEHRPAETVLCAHKVFRIAIGEEKERLPSGRRESGMAGAKARAEALTAEERKAIAGKAAVARWKKNEQVGKKEVAMRRDQEEARKPAATDGAASREFARYPDNRLQEPKMRFEDTSDLRAVVRKHFAGG